MKNSKIFLSIICAVLLFGVAVCFFASCTNVENEEDSEITELKFDINVLNAAYPNTKAVKTGWEVGDKIYVFFYVEGTGYLPTYQYVTLTYNGSAWDGEMGGTNMKLNKLRTSGLMYAVYFPFGNVHTEAPSNGNFVGTSENGALNGKPVYSFYLVDDSGQPYTLSQNGGISTLSGTLTMKLPDNFVYFFIDKQGDDYCQNEQYRLSVDGVKPATVLAWNQGSGFTVHSLGAGQPMWGFKYEGGIAFAGMIDNTWAEPQDHKLIFFSDGDPAHAKTVNTALNSHESVNLKNPGLWPLAMSAPTYTLMFDNLNWADWNLGSNGLNDDKYGEHFRWGEIVPNGTGTYYRSSYVTQNLINDYKIYDAARAMLGADWRMPTQSELVYLHTNDGAGSYSIPSQSSGTVSAGDFSKKGIIIKGNTDPQNSILLRTNGNSDGYYWSSNGSTASAYSITISPTNPQESFLLTGNSDKTGLKAIRPIYIGN